MAVIVGTSGDDVITFPETTTDADTIHAGNGDDYVFAASNDDSVFGGNGNDTLNGGTGNDYIAGGAGDDILFGEIGFDRLYGGTGNDVIVWDDDDFDVTWKADGTFVSNPNQNDSSVANAPDSVSTYNGNSGFDVLNITDAQFDVNLMGRAVQGLESVAVKPFDVSAQQIIASLSEIRQESDTELTTGATITTIHTAFAAVLGNQDDDLLDLVGSGTWSLVDSPTADQITDLSAAELATIRHVNGQPISTGDDDPDTLDLHAFVFERVQGSDSSFVTVWTDLDASKVLLDGNPLDTLLVV
jgi:hypothetical protein